MNMAERKKQPRREKTEEEILNALERVLLRDGAHNISVMSISREAQVAKTLIYKYFDVAPLTHHIAYHQLLKYLNHSFLQ